MIIEHPLCKGESELKKPKLEDFYAYVYAMDSQQYIQAIYQYDHYSRRAGLSAFHPWPSSGVGKTGAKVRDPPLFQHTERVVPPSDREHSFQVNVTKKQDCSSPQPHEDLEKPECEKSPERTESVGVYTEKLSSDETPSGSNEITSSTSPPLLQSVVCEPPQQPLSDSLLRSLPEEARRYIERLQFENERLRRGQEDRDRLIEQLKAQQSISTRSETSEPSPPVQEVTTSQEQEVEMNRESSELQNSDQEEKIEHKETTNDEQNMQLSCRENQSQIVVQTDANVAELKDNYNTEHVPAIGPEQPEMETIDSNGLAEMPTPAG